MYLEESNNNEKYRKELKDRNMRVVINQNPKFSNSKETYAELIKCGTMSCFLYNIEHNV